jgi:hypothetical protein
MKLRKINVRRQQKKQEQLAKRQAKMTVIAAKKK